MSKNRLEAFSDGVIAILITIMVLELIPPGQPTFAALKPLAPTFFSYVLSYAYLAIYWNNHHHMLHTTQHVNGRVMWANLILLFWLSLFPFTTAWVGKTHGASLPTAVYGLNLLMASFAFPILQHTIITMQGEHSLLLQAVSGCHKEKLSMACYAVAIPIAFWMPVISMAIYVGVALMWATPDRRIERLTPEAP